MHKEVLDLFRDPMWVVGKNYHVWRIDADVANKIVKRYHYSGKVVANSNLHLGVFKDGELVGFLSFGPPLNKDKTPLKISDTHHNMLELNRMVMADSEPRNSESQAISLCMKYFKRHTDIDYILSFSDGKEGNVGYIYQATNWLYGGFMLSDSFYLLDGKYMHSVSVWNKYKQKHELRDSHTTNEILKLNYENISTITCKQHIYLMPLKRKINFLIETSKKYPKLENEVKILRIRNIQGNNKEYGEVDDFVNFPITDTFGRTIN